MEMRAIVALTAYLSACQNAAPLRPVDGTTTTLCAHVVRRDVPGASAFAVNRGTFFTYVNTPPGTYYETTAGEPPRALSISEFDSGRGWIDDRTWWIPAGYPDGTSDLF